MSFVQGSHVSLSARPADGKEKQMKDGCGKMSETASAFFDPGTSSWKMSQASLLSEASESLGRLPAWGMTASGGLFEHPTPGHLIAGRDSLALLPTPTAWVQDQTDLDEYLARRAREKAKGKAGNGFGLTLDMAIRLMVRGESSPPQSHDGNA